MKSKKPTETGSVVEGPTAAEAAPGGLAAAGSEVGYFRKLRDLDHAVESHRERDRRALFFRLERGKHRLAMGSPRQAVEDLEEALEIQKEIQRGGAGPAADDPVVLPYAVKAHLADAIRLDTRDRLFAMAPGRKSQGILRRAIERSVKLFDDALSVYQRSTANAEHEAWMVAHKGASITMLCFFAVIAHKHDDSEYVRAFADAEECFRRAIALVAQNAERDPRRGKRYTWAGRFLAFLLALRARPATDGAKSDFELARDELAKVSDSASDHLHSTLLDNTAMLFSYSVFTDDRAAEAGIDAAVASLSVDSEAFRAAHSKAVCMAALLLQNPEDEQLKANVMAAIESARTCAADSLSQASVIMASLALTEALVDRQNIGEAVERANQILGSFKTIGIHPSMEAASMIERSAIWAAVRRFAEHSAYEKSPYFEPCSSLQASKLDFGDLHAHYAEGLRTP